MDLEKANVLRLPQLIHKNIFETNDVVQLVTDKLLGQEGSYRYLSQNPVTSNEVEYLSFELHSPLDMYISGPDGEVSSTTVSIPGAVYRRYGEVQYIFLPLPADDYELKLNGTSDGSFTLDVNEYTGNTITDSFSYSGIPSVTSTHVRLPLTGLTASTTITIDFDGDGKADGVVSAIDDVVTMLSTSTPAVSSEDMSHSTGSYISKIQSPQPTPRVAGISTNANDVYLRELYVVLLQLKEVLDKYQNIIGL